MSSVTVNVKLDNQTKEDGETMATDKNEEEKPFGSATDGETSIEPATNDRARERTLFAQEIQKASQTAFQRIQQKRLLAHHEWAKPLTAAPTAISIMAFLMKTAANKKVAGLEVPSHAVMNTEGTMIMGQLKSPFFHSNLLDCSDVGRSAFLDAQRGMNRINVVVNSIMADGGPITSLLELLEEPEDARLYLKPTLEELKSKATVCGTEVASIQQKFEYWHLFIKHLAIQAKDMFTGVVGKQNEVNTTKTEAETKQKMLDDKRASADKTVEELIAKLQDVSKRVTRAEDTVDEIANEPPPYEPSYFEDMAEAKKLSPDTVAPKNEHGIFVRGFVWLSGHQVLARGDQAHKENHESRELGKQRAHIAEEKARRDKKKQEAQERLQKAKDEEAALYRQLDTARDELSNSRDRLADAKHSFAQASSDLERLGNRILELDDIMNILQKSTQELAKLKGQLESLLIFFSSVETCITEGAVDAVHKFLTLIQTNSHIEGERFINLQLQKSSQKRRVIATALQIQGQFSVISDISLAYVKISNNYIRPAIDRMEKVATTKDEDFPEARRDFSAWCEQTISDIDGVYKETDERMDANMAKRVGMLSTLAIEAADEANADE